MQVSRGNQKDNIASIDLSDPVQLKAARERFDALAKALEFIKYTETALREVEQEAEAERKAEFEKVERGEHVDNVILFPLGAALRYAKRYGWKVFPADVKEKKGCLSREYAGGENWGQSNDLEQLKKNFRKRICRNVGVGIPTGAVNGIFVIEADTPKGHKVDGIANLRQLEAEHGSLPITLMAESPSGSLHYYFKHPGAGIKVKGTAGCRHTRRRQHDGCATIETQ
jgi:bifunctional DNA primase/polymerase-like protein